MRQLGVDWGFEYHIGTTGPNGRKSRATARAGSTTACAGRTADSFPSLPGRAAPQAPRGRQPDPYFSTKYAPLPWPLENQRLVTVFLRV